MSAKNLTLIWSLAILQLVVKAGITICTTIQIASINTPWSKIDSDTKFNVWLGITVLLLSHFFTFITNTLKQVKAGNDLPPDEDDEPPSKTTLQTATAVVVSKTETVQPTQKP